MGIVTRQIATLNAMAAEDMEQQREQLEKARQKAEADRIAKERAAEEEERRREEAERLAMERQEKESRVLAMLHGKYQWRVLHIDEANNRALCITERIIGKLPFDKRGKTNRWEDCSLREWLNTEFFNTLPARAKHNIVATGGDKVFLLSVEEANRYFHNNNDRIAMDATGGAGWWWLRSPGGDSSLAAFVYDFGGRVCGSGDFVDNVSGVRPALWVQL
jgi:hypothetical protein